MSAAPWVLGSGADKPECSGRRTPTAARGKSRAAEDGKERPVMQPVAGTRSSRRRPPSTTGVFVLCLEDGRNHMGVVGPERHAKAGGGGEEFPERMSEDFSF
jgi:hypothetical protein